MKYDILIKYFGAKNIEDAEHILSYGWLPNVALDDVFKSIETHAIEKQIEILQVLLKDLSLLHPKYIISLISDLHQQLQKLKDGK